MENLALLEEYEVTYWSRCFILLSPLPFRMERVIDQDFNDFSAGLRVSIGVFPRAFPGLDVSESCLVTILNYQVWFGLDANELMRW